LSLVGGTATWTCIHPCIALLVRIVLVLEVFKCDNMPLEICGDLYIDGHGTWLWRYSCPYCIKLFLGDKLWYDDIEGQLNWGKKGWVTSGGVLFAKPWLTYQLPHEVAHYVKDGHMAWKDRNHGGIFTLSRRSDRWMAAWCRTLHPSFSVHQLCLGKVQLVV
jgi:hypothetical protein